VPFFKTGKLLEDSFKRGEIPNAAMYRYLCIRSSFAIALDRGRLGQTGLWCRWKLLADEVFGLVPHEPLKSRLRCSFVILAASSGRPSCRLFWEWIVITA